MSITVNLLQRTKRHFIYCWWTDPVTGRKCTKTTKTAVMKTALRFASRLEEQLNTQSGRMPTKLTWAEVRTRFTREHLDGLAIRTKKKADAAMNALERLVNPHLASSLTASVLSSWKADLREEGRAAFTIKGYLIEIGRVLRWAYGQRLLSEVPDIQMPKRLGGTHSRDVTGEEFDRLVAILPSQVGPDAAPSWEHLLRGVWLSGLRLEEAVNLHWTDDRRIMVDTSGRHVMLRIQAKGQKSGQFQLLPLTGDFQEFLLSVPKEQRRGPVFNPRPLHEPYDVRLSHQWVGKKIAQLGKAAGIVVAETTYMGVERKKFATVHDLRRAFGQRWSLRVMPMVLQQLMRHKSISTTMQFYLRKDAEATADAAKLASGVTSGVSGHPERLKEPAADRRPTAN